MNTFMRIESERLFLYPLSVSQLGMAVRNISAAVREIGLSIKPYGFFETLRRRQIYKAKLSIIEEIPHAWMLTTVWILSNKTERSVIGEAGFKGPPADGQIEIGYTMREEYRCRGYMTEAVAALCAAAKHCPEFRVSSVMARTKKNNKASQRVLEKNGFIMDGFIGKHCKWVKKL